MPNALCVYRDGSGFVDVTVPAGVGHLQKGHAVAIADYDGDGDLDIFEQMGGAFPGDAYYDALFRNPGFANRWVQLRLVGVRSNRSAIGARIRVVVVEAGRRRSIYRWVSSGGSFGASPLEQTIGLGRSEAIERVEILWPRTGKVQVLGDVRLDTRTVVTEN